MKDAAVAVPRRIHPGQRHPLAEAVGFEQPIDNFLISVRGLVGEKCVDLFDTRRQARQIERDAPQQPLAVGFGQRAEPLLLQPRKNKCIDWTADPVVLFHVRQGRSFRRHKRPVTFPLCALFDPAADQLDLDWLKFLVRLRRRHLLFRIIRVDSRPRFAAVQVATLERRENAFLLIETHLRLAVFFRRAVALKTIVRQDRPNVPIELHFWIRSRHQRRRCGKACGYHPREKTSFVRWHNRSRP